MGSVLGIVLVGGLGERARLSRCWDGLGAFVVSVRCAAVGVLLSVRCECVRAAGCVQWVGAAECVGLSACG